MLAVLALPASAQAALPLAHQETSAADASAADAYIAPGDTIDIRETLRNTGATTLSGISGTLTPSTSGVAVGSATSTFPDAASDGLTANDSAFTATIDPAVPCGSDLAFTLALKSGTDTTDVPFTVGTGIASALRPFTPTDLPVSIPDQGSTSTSFVVTQSGYVKDLRIHIGQLTHPNDADLKLWIEAPDGTMVTLMDGLGGQGNDLTDTTFVLRDAPDGRIQDAAAPFTGTYLPQGDLTRLLGRPEQGTWTLHVADQKATDSGVLSSWDMGIAQAICSNDPVASIRVDRNPALPGQAVTFDARDSFDPVAGNQITDYSWDLDGDGTYEADTGTTPTASATFSAGSHVVGLRVTDSAGATGVTSMTLPVTQPPVAVLSASPTSPLSGSEVTLDAQGSTDPDGTVVSYAWDLDGDGRYDRTTVTRTTSTSFATPGVHTVGLKVTDNDGATAGTTLDVTVANRPPVARIQAPSVVVTAATAQLDASASSDPDGSIADYSWDLDGDGTYETNAGPAPAVSRAWTTPGTRTIGVRVTDDRGATATATATVVVDDAPVAALSATPNPVVAGGTVAFSAAGSRDADGSIARYQWDLDGDGSFERETGSSPSASATYATAGTRVVKVRVTDDRGVASEASLTLTVQALGPVSPGAGAGGTGTTGGTTGDTPLTLGDLGTYTGPTTAAPGAAAVVGAPIQALALAARRGLTFTCRVSAAARCTVTLLVRGREAVRLRLVRGHARGAKSRRRVRSRIVGRAVAIAAPERPARLVVPLSRPLRRALRRVRRARVVVRSVVLDVQGRRTRATRVVLLRGRAAARRR